MMKKIFGLKSYTPHRGAMIKGLDISEERFRDTEKLPVVDFMSLTGACPHDCEFCFTNKHISSLSFSEHRYVIDQLAELGSYSIQLAGEGEPTFDKNFFKIVEYISSKGIIPLVYTEASTKLREKDFVQRLYDANASVFPKTNSIFNSERQNSVVRSYNIDDYFTRRNEAIEMLMEVGFNEKRDDGLTRLGFALLMDEHNVDEAEKTLRYCRENNIYIMFDFYLPVGRTEKTGNQEIKERRQLAELINGIDEREYGIVREQLFNNFITGPCKESFMIRGNGDIYVCPGNETIIGNIHSTSMKDAMNILEEKFPQHNRKKYSGNCPYRPEL